MDIPDWLKKKIIVVEPYNELARKIEHQVLPKHWYLPLTARDFSGAETIFRDFPDAKVLVVADMITPETLWQNTQGIEKFAGMEVIKRHKNDPGLKILAISSDEEFLAQAKQQGANTLNTTQFNPEVFLKELKHLKTVEQNRRA